MMLNMNSGTHAASQGLPSKQPPKGLLEVGGKVYQLYGFINYFDGRDISLKPEIAQIQTTWGSQAAHFGFNHGPREDTQFQTRLIKQLQGLRLNYWDCYCVSSRTSVIFIFTLYEAPISFKTQITRSAREALFEYIKANGTIPQILSDYRLAQEWGSAEDLKNKSAANYIDFIDRECLDFLLPNQQQSAQKSRTDNKPTPEEWEAQRQARDLEAKNNELSIIKCSDYAEASQTLDVDLMTLHKRIRSQAKQTGGFTEFAYKGQVFEIPKLPLIAWALRLNGASFYYNDLCWRVCSPSELKCADDEPMHSDWWIGTGIPLEAYDLAGKNYSHYMFNREISEFAYDLAKKNTLTSFTVLSGKHLTPIKGNIVRNPQSLDDVSPGDILILPHGGVEFDAYLKKACGNGRGAVILEVGNRVAHLSIVANEMSYRVILLPNVEKLLGNCPKAYIDMQVPLIKPIFELED